MGITGQDKRFISAEDLRMVENFWIYKVQHAVYGHIFQSLGPHSKVPLVKQLGICQSKLGLLECRGRLMNSEILPPVLLPKDHKITRLIVKGIHEENLHMRVGHTLAQVRKRYWIPHGRVLVKNVLRDCTPCKKFHGGPFRLPDMPCLPQSRVTRSEPFQFTGLDYLGPFYIRKTHGETPEKKWICIFTCLAVRAIHLEVVADLSTESFLNSMQRFISRRGTPEKVISDNFSSFKLGKQVLDSIWNDVVDNEEVHSYFAKKGIKWHFITELSPWEGGFYERLIGTVKSCLRKALG